MIRQYEAATGRLSSQQQRAGGASFNGFDYSYTERGNIAAITESGEVTRERAYSYDELERLTEVTVPTTPSQDETYELDAEGNRLSSHLSDMHSTDTANRLESDDSYTYVYDLNGNLISKLAKAGPNGTSGLSNWTYSYDTLDQLIEVEQDGLLVESYRYHSAASHRFARRLQTFGRRSLISTVEGAGLTVDVGLINDGSDRAIDVTQGLLGQAIPLRRYTHSANVDEPLQLETFDTDGTFDAAYTYHADHLGSIRYLTDSSGTIVNAYDYDSYGRPMFGTTSFDQPFAYTGREWDAATGLYHYRARAYDAETGRFLQEDPIAYGGEDFNFYRYVGNNPTSLIDPTGLSALDRGVFDKYATKVAARTRLSFGSRMGCLFSIAEQAVTIGMDQRVDFIGVGEDCVFRTKARKSKGNSNHPNSTQNPKKQNHVYLIFNLDAKGKKGAIHKVGISAGPLRGKNARGKSQVGDNQKLMFIGTNLTRSQALALECAMTWALKVTLKQTLAGDNSACKGKAR